MRNLLSALFTVRDRRRERERAYLDESVSITDLERRMREIERGRFAETRGF